MTRRTYLFAACLAGLGLLAAPACKKANSNEDKEAEAVESKEQGAEKDDSKGDKPGAAAKSGESGSKKGEKAKEGGDAPAKATVGEPAPDFKLKDETGETHQLSDYEGQTVVLEWTSPECPYVVRHYKEEKTMTKTIEALGGSDEVTWLAIDSSHFNTPKKSKKWKEKHGFDFSILQDKNGKVGKLYGAKTTPHMYVVDKEGVLRYKGAIDDDPRGNKKYDERTNYVQKAVQALKKGEDVSPKTTDPYGCSVKYDS